MPPVCRKPIDICDGACTAPPERPIESSPNVFTNGLGQVRKTDAFQLHARPLEAPHSRVVLKGSSTVFVNGLDIARLSDPLTCGAFIAKGSPNVFAGG